MALPRAYLITLASVELHFAGHYDPSDFVVAADADGSTLLTVQHHDVPTGELLL